MKGSSCLLDHYLKDGHRGEKKFVILGRITAIMIMPYLVNYLRGECVNGLDSDVRVLSEHVKSFEEIALDEACRAVKV